MPDFTWPEALWDQFGGAIDMLERAIVAFPEAVWSDRSRNPEVWAMAFHTVFWLDYYLADDPKSFAPPAPFGLEEMDPAGVLAPNPFDRADVLAYLRDLRERCRTLILGLTAETAMQPRKFGGVQGSTVESLLYSLRHLQHHTGQLNLLLRQTIDSAPLWVRRAGQVPPPR